jgi:hypothetical protein
MRKVGCATILGIVIALALIYWMRPLNKGAVSLVTLLSIGLANLVVSAVAWFMKSRHPR